MAIGRQTKTALKVAGKKSKLRPLTMAAVTDTILLVAFICNGNIQ